MERTIENQIQISMCGTISIRILIVLVAIQVWFGLKRNDIAQGTFLLFYGNANGRSIDKWEFVLTLNC